jgi:hypothetical protein
MMALLAALLLVCVASADVPVPAKLQAQLIAKIAAFDRNFPARAAGNALVLVVFKQGDAESTQLATQLASELRALPDVGGVPATVDVVPFDGATGLAATCRSRRAAIVYLSASLAGNAGAVAAALAGGDVLSVGATAAHAEGGTAIGFDLEGGRPKILVNLSAARAQNVSLKADLLRLARLVGS